MSGDLSDSKTPDNGRSLMQLVIMQWNAIVSLKRDVQQNVQSSNCEKNQIYLLASFEILLIRESVYSNRFYCYNFSPIRIHTFFCVASNDQIEFWFVIVMDKEDFSLLLVLVKKLQIMTVAPCH